MLLCISPHYPLGHRWGLIDIPCCQVPHGGAINFGQIPCYKDQIPHYGHRGFDITMFPIQVVGQMPQSGAKVCCQIFQYSPTCAQGV